MDAEYSFSNEDKGTTTKELFPSINEKDIADPENEILVETDDEKALIYRINDVPPFYLTFIFALQHILLFMATPLTLTLIIAEIVCIQSDEYLKLQILSAIMFITGLSTFVMTTVGVRLPIFQGTSTSYVIPLLAMSTVKEWACPATFKEFDPTTNETVLMAYVDNATAISAREMALEKIGVLSGSLFAVGAVHFLIGITGLVGFLIRYIGPITIVPTIVMIGLNVFKPVVKFMEPNIGISFLVIACNLVLTLLLGKKQTPIPWWTKSKGFHIFWYPLHCVLSILFSILLGWSVSAILTHCGAFTDDPDDKGYLARTDARNFIVEQSDWFMLPHAGTFGGLGFNTGVFVNFLIATLLSVLDSIGDYAAAARTAHVSHPPHYAFNRGIAVEGLMSALAGALGCCVATVSFGSAIGAMGLTRVVSRKVFQLLGLLFIFCSVMGKIGAIFIIIPLPVLGGSTLIIMGIFIGVVVSYLQTVDLNSTRNLAIIGISLLLGLVMPHWATRNGDSIDTGYYSLDLTIKMLLANPSFVCGVFSCAMDNIIPGTLKERGIIHQMKDLEEDEEDDQAQTSRQYLEDRVYRLPFIPQSVRRSKLARRFLPIFDYEDSSICKRSREQQKM